MNPQPYTRASDLLSGVITTSVSVVSSMETMPGPNRLTQLAPSESGITNYRELPPGLKRMNPGLTP